MKKTLATILFSLILVGNLSAFTELDNLLIAEATTPDLKKIAKDYFNKKAKDHKELAEKYKSLAGLSHGGKATADAAEKKKYEKLSEHCEKEAAAYKAQADKF
ncbi:hypothetical protein [Leptospira licerasiae]|uniref:Uncharacterized protein n=1 Tax=Leptospira licerasiae str. MMD4847 TaxID=1049971 RepID=A0ABN0HDI5_9LEPT|nr:hypothetical protein [Leptospira licerasiae]EIE01770.1 hypothetical protein LEP1GSC185_2977 [Leptospira licerasiae serovar Varillal str. VAR 010]EJZ43447.1 hypothetical protein LEP1GSC178_2595 [Leptospira licerasiae str. MMD4847]TGM86360.1 hypothetical protein EHR05_15520 [Leptospira licerasiae]